MGLRAARSVPDPETPPPLATNGGIKHVPRGRPRLPVSLSSYGYTGFMGFRRRGQELLRSCEGLQGDAPAERYRRQVLVVHAVGRPDAVDGGDPAAVLAAERDPVGEGRKARSHRPLRDGLQGLLASTPGEPQASGPTRRVRQDSPLRVPERHHNASPRHSWERRWRLWSSSRSRNASER